jgi:hypothetical protein
VERAYTADGRWPTRVVGLPRGRSLYRVTAILRDNAPPNVDQLFADELGALKRLVEKNGSPELVETSVAGSFGDRNKR